MSPSGTSVSSRSSTSWWSARGEVRASSVDADERDGAAGVLLHDLVRDADERASDVVLVQDDALLVGHMDLPGLTGPG